jgi:hypothetical protein
LRGGEKTSDDLFVSSRLGESWPKVYKFALLFAATRHRNLLDVKIENQIWSVVALLTAMPSIVVDSALLGPFGAAWQAHGQKLTRTPPNSSSQLGCVFDKKVGDALSALLGGIPIIIPSANALGPARPDCVEVGPCRIVGGVRPQNFDVGYRPDGVRFAFDSKTLNDTESVRKNYQNMINDLGTEATTVHTRFPYAVVAFMVIIPSPCLGAAQRAALTFTLERLTERTSPLDSVHKAEAISLILWDPATGAIDSAWPGPASPLRVEFFSSQIEKAYVSRYKGLPPHAE